jgi:hypothetical protein
MPRFYTPRPGREQEMRAIALCLQRNSFHSYLHVLASGLSSGPKDFGDLRAR